MGAHRRDGRAVRAQHHHRPAHRGGAAPGDGQGAGLPPGECGVLGAGGEGAGLRGAPRWGESRLRLCELAACGLAHSRTHARTYLFTSPALTRAQMIVEPEQRVADFAKAGADIISVHVEQQSTIHLHRTVNMVRGGLVWGRRCCCCCCCGGGAHPRAPTWAHAPMRARVRAPSHACRAIHCHSRGGGD